MNDMENNATESLENKLENMRKSRNEFKCQVEYLRIAVETKDNIIKQQCSLINKLIDAICDLSKVVKR